jgi:hypothetical protein
VECGAPGTGRKLYFSGRYFSAKYGLIFNRVFNEKLKIDQDYDRIFFPIIPSIVARLGAKVTRNLKITPLCRRPTKTKKEFD